MASKNNTIPVEEIPDEMDDSEVTGRTTSATSNGETVSDGGLSLDELDAKGLDDRRMEEAANSLDAPGGDWDKVERWEFEKKVYSNDVMPGDLDPSGRVYFVFKGEAKARTVGGKTYKPKMFYRISPDVRYKEDDPETFDIAHRLFLRGRETFITVRGEKPTLRSLIIFLAEDDYSMRTMKGDGAPIVLGIKQTYVKNKR